MTSVKWVDKVIKDEARCDINEGSSKVLAQIETQMAALEVRNMKRI